MASATELLEVRLMFVELSGSPSYVSKLAARPNTSVFTPLTNGTGEATSKACNE